MSTIRRRVVPLGFGLLGAAAAVGVGSAVSAAGTDAALMTISFPPTTVVAGEPGTVHEVAASDVADDQVGQSCSVTVTTENNVSAHPQSDVVVRSGTSEVTAFDVEAASGGTTTATGTLVLGSTVTVSVHLGSDGLFSGGGDVELVCTEVSPSSSSTTSTTQAPAADVSAPPAAVAGAVEVAPGFTG